MVLGSSRVGGGGREGGKGRAVGRDDGWDSGLYLVVTFSKVGYYVLCAWGERKSLGEFKRCLFQMICLIFGGIF